ncbi:MAG: hypothetical protein HRT57_08195 [Crocinitomicaceae bacterium]|nr:hypothetical protein [Crocinitomicaceae bacterium]
MIPAVINILGEKILRLLWWNVILLIIVIGVQIWGLDHSSENITWETGTFADKLYFPAFYFPFYGLGFAILAALLYTFYGRSTRESTVKNSDEVIDEISRSTLIPP